MKTLPSKEILDELLHADFYTGKLYWKKRDVKWFVNPNYAKSWNIKYSNKEAFVSLDSKYYLRGAILNKHYSAHRIIYKMYYGVDADNIDHINGIRNDNRIKNLRSVTHQENLKNQKLRLTNTSGIQGVSWNKNSNKWEAKIQFKGKKFHLGLFKNIKDAQQVRKDAEIKYGFYPNHGKNA